MGDQDVTSVTNIEWLKHDCIMLLEHLNYPNIADPKWCATLIKRLRALEDWSIKTRYEYVIEEVKELTDGGTEIPKQEEV